MWLIWSTTCIIGTLFLEFWKRKQAVIQHKWDLTDFVKEEVRIRQLQIQMSCRMTKPTKWPVHPAKTQISLGIHLVWSESLLSAWRNLWSLTSHWEHSEDTDQTGRMPRLIWVFAGRTGDFVGFCVMQLKCCNDSKYLERHVWENSVDPDQTALEGSGSTLCMIKPCCSNFRIIAAILFWFLAHLSRRLTRWA